MEAELSAVAHKTRARKNVQESHNTSWTKGRGKGGRKLRPTQGLLPLNRRRVSIDTAPRGKLILEAKKLRRQDWSDWLKRYKTQTETMLKSFFKWK